nr:uncharacterized protein LOC105346367 [Crassostrea gigas]
MHSFINCIQLRFVLLLYVMSVSASGFILDYRDLVNNDPDSSPQSKSAFLQRFIRRLRSDDLDTDLNLRTLVPRDYNSGRFEGTSVKRDYGINPPFHELCRMMNMPYCSYRS